MKIPILLYHRITDEPAESLRRFAVSPPAFAGQMRYLASHGFQAASLDDVLCHYREGKKLPRKTVVITFDDGYLDNYLYAFPVLRRYGFTATVFQVAGHIGGFAEWDHTYGGPMPRLVSWKELRLMAADGVEIGAHTCSHPFLTQLPLAEARHEIAASKAMIEAGLQREVKFFAYPYKEYNEDLRKAVVESGFAAACSSIGGQSDAGDDRFMLRRLSVMGTYTLEDFRWLVDSPHHHSFLHRIVRGKRSGLMRAIRGRR